jgi:hypothetical protein
MSGPAIELLRHLDRTALAPSREGHLGYGGPWQARLVAGTTTIGPANPMLVEERLTAML